MQSYSFLINWIVKARNVDFSKKYSSLLSPGKIRISLEYYRIKCASKLSRHSAHTQLLQDINSPQVFTVHK